MTDRPSSGSHLSDERILAVIQPSWVAKLALTEPSVAGGESNGELVGAADGDEVAIEPEEPVVSPEATGSVLVKPVESMKPTESVDNR